MRPGRVNSSLNSFLKNNMDKGKTKDQVEELMRNQTFILEAVRNLNERLEMIEQNYGVEKMN